MNKLTLVATLALAAALILGGAVGNRSSADVILVPNGDFETLYKPGTAITGVVSAGGWTQGVGPECPIDSGVYEFSDFTTGDLADIPGWFGYDRQGWIDLGGTYGRDQTTGHLQGSIASQGPLNGVHCYLGNGSNWGNQAGALIVSADPLATVESGLSYTLSMMATGGVTPVVLDLLADGVALTPSSSMDPPDAGAWREISRTYDATSLSGHDGEALTIVLGHGRPAAGTQNRYDDVSLVNFSGLVWDNGDGDNNWGTPNNWDPDPLIPTAAIPATINHGTPLVEADHEVLAVRINAGELTIGAGNTLTITNGINSDGMVVLENGSRISTGSGSIAEANIDGRTSIAVYAENNLDVASLFLLPVPGKAPGELVKEDAGTLTLHGDSLSVDNLILAAGTMTVVGQTDTDFTVAGDATLHLETPSTADLGNLILENGTVTLTGAPDGISFASTTVDASATAVGLNPQTDTDLRVINGNDANVVISKYGDRTLVLDQLNVGLDMATFNVEGGRLVGVPAEGPAKADVNPFGGAQLEINGAELVLAGRVTDSAAAFENNVIAVSGGTLTAGSGGNGTLGVTVSVAGGGKSVTVNDGASLTLRSDVDYRLSIVGDLTGPGSVEVTEGTVALAAVDVGGMEITGGAVGASANLLVGTMQQTGGMLDLAGNVVRVSDTLSTRSAAYTISQGDTFDATGDASGNMIDGANLTLNVADSTLSISGLASGPVPNGDFETLYKPGTAITGVITTVAGTPGGWAQGVGPECPIDDGQYVFDDGTTGDVADIPGWLGYDRQGWIDLGGTYGRDQTTGHLQGSVAGQYNFTEGGAMCYLGNGDQWANPAGALIVSADPLGAADSGIIYTLSMMANGVAEPVVLDLLADGVALTPSSSVDPILAPEWQEFSRTYDATSLSGHDGEPLTIVLGHGRPATGTQSRYDDVSLTAVPGPNWSMRLPETNLLVTANSEITCDATSVTLGNLTIEEGATQLTLSDSEFSFQDVTTPQATTIAGGISVRGGLNVGGSAGLLTVNALGAAFEFGENSTYNVEIAEWDSPGGLPPLPPLPAPPMDPTINDRVHTTAGDIYLDGELTLTAVAKLHPRVPHPDPPHVEVEWYGDQTRVIASTEGEDQVSWTFATVPTPQPESWDDLLTGTPQWSQGHIGRGVFLTRQNDGGENDAPGISYGVNSTKLHLFQACDGDTNGDRTLGGRDIQNIQSYALFGLTEDPGPGYVWPPDWPQGDFDGDGLVTGLDISAILATGLWPTDDYAAIEPGQPLDGVVDLLLYPEDVTLEDGTVIPAGSLMIDPDGLTLNGYVLRSEAGVFTGAPAQQLNWFFVEDTDRQISGNMGATISALQDLGPVVGPEWTIINPFDKQDVNPFDDLTLTYTVVGTPGTFVGNLIVVPEPGTMAMLLTGVVGLLLLLRRRRMGASQ